ncbi:MAG: tRNA dihydrouridine synthase DusB [Deltaproteobacteria bacterium]|nr:tRNA dihydrouridine synthase DusB [Deltaproteobacteria bacterium]
MSFRIGNLTISPGVLMAPMAGITDSPFRRVLKSLGCPAVVTEMVSAEGLIRQGIGTLTLLDYAPEEKPIIVQLFGSKPDSMAEAARLVSQHGFAAIDINMGCPVPKVVNKGAGAALMREPERAEALVRAVRQASDLPLSVKLRSGWDQTERNVAEVARRLSGAGVDAFFVHPRTRAQAYQGQSDWSLIAETVRAVEQPVIGNGDLHSLADGKRMLDETGCAGLMVGRAALKDPWLPGLLAGVDMPYPATIDERNRVFCMHLDFMLACAGSEQRAVQRMRKHLAWYSQGLRGAAHLRRQLQHMDTADDMRQAFTQLEAINQKRTSTP